MVATLAVLGRRASYAEFLDLPDGLRAEYVNGEILMNPPPSVAHQQICQRLLFTLARVVSADRVVLAAGWKLHADRPDVRIPDVAVMSGPTAGNLITEAPLVVVEVLSSNRYDDLVRKSAEYLEVGVGQYWIIDPRDEVLDVFGGTATGWERLVHLTREAPEGSVSIADLGVVELSLVDLLDG